MVELCAAVRGATPFASGQGTMRKVDGWQSFGQPPANTMMDLAARRESVIAPTTAAAMSNTSRDGTRRTNSDPDPGKPLPPPASARREASVIHNADVCHSVCGSRVLRAGKAY